MQKTLCVHVHICWFGACVQLYFRGYYDLWFEIELMILGDSYNSFWEETSGMVGRWTEEKLQKKIVSQREKNVNVITVIFGGSFSKVRLQNSSYHNITQFSHNKSHTVLASSVSLVILRLKSSFSFLLIFNWKIIALQNFVVFCQTSTQISHRF